MKHIILVLPFVLTLSVSALWFFPESPSFPVSAGSFDNHIDIGDPAYGGSVIYKEDNQTYRISGSGHGFDNTGDELHYLWKAIQGDFILRAELDKTDAPTGGAFGWSVRSNISADSEMISFSADQEGTILIIKRAERGGEIIRHKIDANGTDVLQIERIGGVFRAKSASFGTPLETVFETQVNLGNEVLGGLFVHSDENKNMAEVTFRNVRIVKPFPDGEARQGRYLGSRLEIVNVETGNRKVLYETKHSIQAPNWTPDGKTLIYNSNGYLYNFDLETGQISHLNTGFATNNNNDHVITFDGKQIAISHHVPEDNYQSTIYILPIEGSDHPKQVTRTGAGHAYLHGISPDNQTVIFTGWRNDKFDIYAADVNTMEETQLTDTPYLDDGSEYSPDGEYIWFNSNRTGTMEIWRMNADGSDQTQITFDENFHDWFPHISPDGEKVLFLSYGLDVDSADHPFYRQVTLRMMSAEGGEPEIVAYLYGGQGTINVPSWSPDSRYVAFVSNSGRYY